MNTSLPHMRSVVNNGIRMPRIAKGQFEIALPTSIYPTMETITVPRSKPKTWNHTSKNDMIHSKHAVLTSSRMIWMFAVTRQDWMGVWCNWGGCVHARLDEQ